MRASFALLGLAIGTVTILCTGASIGFGFPLDAAFSADPSTQDSSLAKDGLRLELEAPDGTLRQVAVGMLDLADPRAEQAWIVRILGARQAEPSGERDEDSVEITLIGGDRLHGQIQEAAGETLTLRIAGGALLPLGIEAIERIFVPGHLPESLAAPLEAPREGDRIYRRTGDTLDRDDGTVLGFHGEGVLFESAVLGQRQVAWGELAALYVEPLGAAESGTDSAGVPAVFDLADGGRLHARLVNLGEKKIELLMDGGTELALPLSSVLTVTILDGRIEYLSNLIASDEIGRGAPFGDEVGLVLGHLRDTSVIGDKLRVGGRQYPRGIGTHAPTRVIYDLPEGWTQLRGKVGIDDSSARLPVDARGSVRFRIKLDGKLLWESQTVRGGDGVLVMPALDLPGAGAARQLELEVDPVEDFRGDRADWLDMILSR